MFTNNDPNELNDLLKDFYSLTGMKISIHDEDGRELASYPARLVPFCKRLRCDRAHDELCRRCDENAIRECRRTKKILIYCCHAGLTECFAPVLVNNAIRGFIAVGQIREKKEYTCAVGDELLREEYEKMPLVPRGKIEAALHVLNAIASYDKLKDYVRDTAQSFSARMLSFIDGRLKGELGVEALQKKMWLSRAELYRLCALAFDCTPAELIKKRRLSEAEKLLRETDMSISAVAEQCGIGDYNYFSKVFKKAFGVSPREYRKRGEIK